MKSCWLERSGLLQPTYDFINYINNKSMFVLCALRAEGSAHKQTYFDVTFGPAFGPKSYLKIINLRFGIFSVGSSDREGIACQTERLISHGHAILCWAGKSEALPPSPNKERHARTRTSSLCFFGARLRKEERASLALFLP